MNIFQKDCPECAAANSIDAVSCRCGYCFDPETLARTDPTEYAQQQDRLYRDYLAARIVQAEAELIVAREQAKADPENTYRASGVLLAEQALNALQAEMKHLSLRIPPAAPRRAVPAAPPPPPAAVKVTHVKAVAEPTRATPTVAPTKTMEAAPKAEVAPKAAAPITANDTKRVAATKAKPAPVSRPVPAPSAPAKTASAAVRPAKEQRAAARPSITAKPDHNFKRVQAERAEAIARANAAAKPPTPAAKTAGTKRPAPRPAAQVPPLVLAPAAPMQECPNCTATVPADRKRCSCGYAFSRAAEEVPAVTLDAAALAILTEGISAAKRTTRRR